MKALSKTKKRLLLAALLLLVLAASGLDSRLKTVYYSLESPKITGDGIRIALITDLHSCAYGEKQAQLIAAIGAAAPDIVLLCGDIFDEDMPDDQALALAAALPPLYPCYYVTGNHEAENGADEYCETLSALGISVLRDESVVAEVGENRIFLCGLSDPGGRLNAAWVKNELAARLEAFDRENAEGLYSILLSHRPDFILYSPGHSFDLVLSGHTHGGQWRIPGLLNGLLAPDQGLFPKYAGGLYALDEGASTLIVSRGLARESTSVPRVWNRPELVIVDIGAE